MICGLFKTVHSAGLYNYEALIGLHTSSYLLLSSHSLSPIQLKEKVKHLGSDHRNPIQTDTVTWFKYMLAVSVKGST